MDLVLAVAVVHHGGRDHEAEGDAELKKRMALITIQSGKIILPVKNFFVEGFKKCIDTCF